MHVQVFRFLFVAFGLLNVDCRKSLGIFSTAKGAHQKSVPIQRCTSNTTIMPLFNTGISDTKWDLFSFLYWLHANTMKCVFWTEFRICTWHSRINVRKAINFNVELMRIRSRVTRASKHKIGFNLNTLHYDIAISYCYKKIISYWYCILTFICTVIEIYKEIARDISVQRKWCKDIGTTWKSFEIFVTDKMMQNESKFILQLPIGFSEWNHYIHFHRSFLAILMSFYRHKAFLYSHNFSRICNIFFVVSWSGFCFRCILNSLLSATFHFVFNFLLKVFAFAFLSSSTFFFSKFLSLYFWINHRPSLHWFFSPQILILHKNASPGHGDAAKFGDPFRW